MTHSAYNLPGRLLILLVTLVATFLLLSGTGEASEPTITMEHRVRSGDTLWDIAGGIVGPGEDVRDVVAMIRDINGLTSSQLMPGQMLRVPID
ncbi:MAG: LysM peptidoglycan-binding domain-containing protein [Acidimicrobiia bacterium]|nr:LysM peptidoglycan-binding domain-containing protein [Acidimicrobiia bacterium]MDH5293372.1 LysM peptidoglycan-binding domain-containing protein [Acidimicrobiia bacterium]MDH5521058.1 LysM peptidoglycan-binding domain-containing protein [Acidimicrobiia bacterium]